MTEDNLFKLLDLNYYSEEDRQKLNSEAIIREVQQNPSTTQFMYKFSTYYGNQQISCLPLHQAIKLRAPASVVDALCSPTALKTKYCGNTALHLAMEYDAPFDLVCLLLQKQPEAAKEKTMEGYTPLHRACLYQASIEVIKLLLQTYPDASQQKINGGYTPLHVACEYEASVEVVSLLLQTWPEASRERTNDGYTPLHFACKWRASVDVVSLLLSSWPESIRAKTTRGGYTPLHLACHHSASRKVVSLLMQRWPDGVTEKTGDDNNNGSNGYTPLHLACRYRTSMDVLLLVLEKWIGLTTFKKDKLNHHHHHDDELEKMKFGTSEEIKKLLSHISVFFHNKNDSNNHQVAPINTLTASNPPPTQNMKQAIQYFTHLKWYNGILCLINKYPTNVTKIINYGNVNIMAAYLELVGRRCRLKIMWEIICNEQDLLADV